MPLELYSPVNFFVGVQVTLRNRSRVTLAQALDEAETAAPRWAFRLAASLLGGLLVLLALIAALHLFAAPVVDALAQQMTAKHVAMAVGCLVALTGIVLLARLSLSFSRFYVAMCRIGAEARALP